MSLCPNCGTPNQTNAKSCGICGANLENPQYPTALRMGTKLQSDKYSIEEVLGQGGFGMTYKAQNTALGITVVIKEFHPEGSTRVGKNLRPPRTYAATEFTKARRRFSDEAKVVARLTQTRPNEHIVRVYDVFTENDTEYYAMEFLEGKSLQTIVEEKGLLTEQDVLKIAREIINALELIHDAKFLHRDIKPDNVMIVDRGSVLIDFGSAREMVGLHTIIVSPGYSPLEQYASIANRGPYTDVYALGGTLRFALTGESPVAATDRVSGVKQKTTRELNPTISHVFSCVLEKALEMKISDRFQSAKELLSAIESAIDEGLSAQSTVSMPTSRHVPIQTQKTVKIEPTSFNNNSELSNPNMQSPNGDTVLPTMKVSTPKFDAYAPPPPDKIDTD
jgi:serine/threonine protein kinase